MALKVVPVAVERLSNVVCASLPQVRVDRVTGEIRTDRATGQPQYEVYIMALSEGEREPSVMQVRVPGEPVGLQVGAPVRLFDLVERKWDMDGRSGVNYTASAITAVAPQAAQGPEPQGAGKAPGGRGVTS